MTAMMVSEANQLVYVILKHTGLTCIFERNLFHRNSMNKGQGERTARGRGCPVGLSSKVYKYKGIY